MTRTTPRTGDEMQGARSFRTDSLPAGDRGDVSPIIRHAALLLAALTAYLLRSHLGAGNEVLWVLGFVALFNTLSFFLSTRGLATFGAPLLSVATGLAGWTALIHLTGGSSSPFVAGLGLEVVVTASIFGPWTASGVLLGAWSGLWAQQAILGFHDAVAELALQSLLLAATGLAAALIRNRWAAAHERARSEAELSRRRLVRLEERLQDLQAVEQAGGNVVRLAHGLKNAVGSLRGFAELIQRRAGQGEHDAALLKGLDASVRRLEELSHLLMKSPGAAPARQEAGPSRAPEGLIRAAVGRAAVKHPGIRWSLDGEERASETGDAAGALEEILEVLLDNAAEAMEGTGEVSVSVRARDGSMQIEVRDQGRGIPAERLESLFRPGRTTKPRGSGFGLWVARRLAESQGGRLEVGGGAGGPGASFFITLPVGSAR